MIWATVSSWSRFCWMYRVSPSLAAKNIISLILVLTIWWCSCVERGCLLWPVRSLGKTLLASALLHSVLQGKICLVLPNCQVFLDILCLHSNPLWWKGHLFGGVSSRRSSYNCSTSASSALNISLNIFILTASPHKFLNLWSYLRQEWFLE